MALNENNFDELLNPLRMFLSQIASVVLQRSVCYANTYLTTTLYLTLIVRKFSKVLTIAWSMLIMKLIKNSLFMPIQSDFKISVRLKNIMKHGTLTIELFVFS